MLNIQYPQIDAKNINATQSAEILYDRKELTNLLSHT